VVALSLADVTELARLNRGDEWRVAREKARLSLDAGNDDGVHVTRECPGFGSHDFEMQRHEGKGVREKRKAI